MVEETKSYGRFQFQGRSYKRHNPNYIIYEGPSSERPRLTRRWEEKIFEIENVMFSLFGITFATCIIEKRKWEKNCWGKEKSGISTNFTFISNDGKIMWRKTGYGSGTSNKIYTGKKNQFYTNWLCNPSV